LLDDTGRNLQELRPFSFAPWSEMTVWRCADKSAPGRNDPVRNEQMFSESPFFLANGSPAMGFS
jgi:hypothetical protein